MTDKPIIFSAPMVRALLDGSKTQTRRFLSIKGQRGFFQFGPSDTRGYDWTFRRKDHVWEDYEHDKLLGLLPIQVGDRLWVRENWCLCGKMDGIKPSKCSKNEPVGYLADGTIRELACSMISQGRTRPSIHMPRWASRLTLTVTDVRVQRLQDISEADAIAEGSRPFWDKDNPHDIPCPDGSTMEMMPLKGPQDAFQKLWNSINGPDAWAENPWVTAYIFTVEKRNIDGREVQ